MGMGITCTPMGIYSHRFYATVISLVGPKLTVGPLAIPSFLTTEI